MQPRHLVVLSVLLALTAACGSIGRPSIDSVSDAIAVTSADIETIAEQVKSLCGNTVPGGDCAPGALIDTATKERLRGHLQEALDMVKSANTLLAADEAAQAETQLARVDAVLRAVRSELQRRSQ